MFVSKLPCAYIATILKDIWSLQYLLAAEKTTELMYVQALLLEHTRTKITPNFPQQFVFKIVPISKGS